MGENRTDCDEPPGCEDRFGSLEEGQRRLSADITALTQAVEADMRTMRNRVNRLAEQTESVARLGPLVEAVDSRQPDMLRKLGALRDGLSELVGKVDALSAQVSAATRSAEERS